MRRRGLKQVMLTLTDQDTESPRVRRRGLKLGHVGVNALAGLVASRAEAEGWTGALMLRCGYERDTIRYILGYDWPCANVAWA